MSENTAPETTERIKQLGPDRVTISEQQVVIEAKRRLPDWQVREMNPIPIYFEDKKYYLAEQRRTEGRYAVRYLLLPWPEGQSTSAKAFFTYDAEAVAERDGACRMEHAHNAAFAFLCPLYPFLGWLWSDAQRRLNRFGFVPRTITGLSIFTTFGLLFGQGVFTVISIQATVRSGKMLVGGIISALAPVSALHLGPVSLSLAWFDVLLAVALLADVLVRYSLYLKEDQWIGGFLEWLVRRAPEDEESAGDGSQAELTANESRGGLEQHRLLARLSFWVPLAVLVVCVAIDHTFKEASTPMSHTMLVSSGRLLGVGLLAGIGLGIAGLCGIRKYGSRGILWPAVRGFVMSVVMLAIFASGFTRGFRNTQMLARAHETSRQVTADFKRDLTNTNDLARSLESRQAGLDKLRGALDTVSQNASGDTALIAKVSSQHLAKMQALMTAYGAAFNALKNPQALDMSGVTNRQQLLDRKDLVKQFLAANEKLQTFIATGTETYRADLGAAGVTSDQKTQALAGYERSAAAQKPLLLRIREDDRAMGNGMLAMLDLLDSNWGKWTYNPARQNVDFQDPATLDKFISYREAVQAAAQDQHKQQVKMASLMN